RPLLEAGLPGDQPGRDVAAVDGGAAVELARGQPGHAVGDPAQGRAADVLAHGGEVLVGGRAAVGGDAVRAAEHDPAAVLRIEAVHGPVDDQELRSDLRRPSDDVPGGGHVLLGHVLPVPADRGAGPGLAVVGDADDPGAGTPV